MKGISITWLKNTIKLDYDFIIKIINNIYVCVCLCVCVCATMYHTKVCSCVNGINYIFASYVNGCYNNLCDSM